MLPNFLCIGAPKAGTTTLQDILIQHKDIFLPEKKELHFFDDPSNYEKGLKWYEDQFADSTCSVNGEITPAYMYYPAAPSKIKSILGPKTRFIVMLRNPVDRAFSEYLHNHRRGLIKDIPFHEAIKLEYEQPDMDPFSRRYFSFVSRGLYSVYIERFLKEFPLNQFKFIITETELRNEPAKTFKEVFEFLGVKDQEIDLNSSSNTAFVPKNLQINKAIYKPNPILRFLIPSFTIRKKIREFAASLNSGKTKPPVVDAGMRKKLMDEYYTQDILKLEKLIKKDLSAWLNKK